MSRTARLYLLALVVGMLPALAIAVAGCGGGGSTTVVETVTEKAPTTTDAETTPTGAETTTPEEETTTPEVEVPDTEEVVHLDSFQSPSGNIGCIMFEGGARCDIDKHGWTPPPRPASCSDQVDYGQGLQVAGTGGGTVVCAGDTAMSQGDPILAYGNTSAVGGATCVSEESGITCMNRDGGGFFISVQGYKLF